MAVELGVHCKVRPDAQVTGHLVGPIMSSLLSNELVGAWIDESSDSWTANWGGAATARVTLLPSGWHEFGDDWFATVAPGERGVQLSLLFAIVITILIAVTYDGYIVDDLSILGSDPPSGAQVLVLMLSCHDRSPEEILAALGDTRDLRSPR